MPSKREGKLPFHSKVSKTSIADATLQIEIAEEDSESLKEPKLEKLASDEDLIKLIDQKNKNRKRS